MAFSGRAADGTLFADGLAVMEIGVVMSDLQRHILQVLDGGPMPYPLIEGRFNIENTTGDYAVPADDIQRALRELHRAGKVKLTGRFEWEKV